MRRSLIALAILLAPATPFAQLQRLRAVADTTVSQSTADRNLGDAAALRVRGHRRDSFASLLRFDVADAAAAAAPSVALRLFCIDGSASGGTLHVQQDSGWEESELTWSGMPALELTPVAQLGAVSTGKWITVDVTAAVHGGARVFVISGGVSNSAFYSSREGNRPPELVLGEEEPGEEPPDEEEPPAEAPTAAFSAAPLTGQAPLQTVFTDQSTGEVSEWLWDFGDGESSTAQSPVHTYASAGTYSVTLTVMGPGGDAELTRSGYVRVLAAAVTGGIWTSAIELEAMAMSGSAWRNVLDEADRSLGTPNIADQADDTDVRVLAKALVYARTGDESYRSQVITACKLAIGSEQGGRTLALGRNLIAYVIAADLVGLPAADDTAFRAWLRGCLTSSYDGDTLRSTHEERPNNWGTHAGASRSAAAAYLGDTAELERCARVFRGWLGDRSAHAGFKYGDTSWQADPARPVGINPRGATKDGRNIDGVLPDDQRRAGGFVWPPPKENYVWEALQGALAQAVILDRAGYDCWEWSDQALLRAVTWLHETCGYPADGDDTWQPHVVNHFYGSDFPAPAPSRPGKNVGWTDWSHP
jgi:PKD repeat protein